MHRLKYPDIPCLNVGTPRKPVYLPAEVCEVNPTREHSALATWCPLPECFDVGLLLQCTALEARKCVYAVNTVKHSSTPDFQQL